MIMMVLLILILFCALGAMRTPRILHAALWLAAVSALMAILFYLVDAPMLAVIELSVGTGLVTVFMVFAITMIGDERESIGIKPFPLAMILITLLLLIFVTVPFLPDAKTSINQSFSLVLWENRGLDMLLQVVLIFAGMIGVLGILHISNEPDETIEETIIESEDKQSYLEDDYTFSTESQQNTLEKEVI